MPLNQAELDQIKPHLNKENSARATQENALSLLIDQMCELSTCALAMVDELDRSRTAEQKQAERLKSSLHVGANRGR